MLRRLLLTLVILSLWTSVAHAAVAFDAVGSFAVTNNATTTATFTVTPVGTPTAVACGISNYTGGGITISSVSYGASSMGAAKVTQNFSTDSAIIWGLANPPSGAQTVTVTFSGTGAFALGACVTVTGSDTTTVFSNTNSATATSAAPSATVTSASGELAFDIVANNSSDTETVNCGNTQQWFNVVNGTNYAYVSTNPSGGATTTNCWTQSASAIWGQAIASFKAAAGVAAPPTRSLLGVGK